jgi:predicted Zn-dependent peptidase
MTESIEIHVDSRNNTDTCYLMVYSVYIGGHYFDEDRYFLVGNGIDPKQTDIYKNELKLARDDVKRQAKAAIDRAEAAKALLETFYYNDYYNVIGGV